MALSYEELAARYPVDREAIEADKERMLADVRAYQLREQEQADPRLAHLTSESTAITA